MNYQSKSPPMYVWGMTFILVFVVVVTSSFFVDRSFVRDSIERLHLFSNTGEKRIIAIGSSLLGHATFYDYFMSDFGSEKGFDEFSFLQITRGSGSLEDFAPLMHALATAKPNIVVIESNLLLLRDNKISRLNVTIRRHKKYVRKNLFLPLRYVLGSKPRKIEMTRDLPYEPTRLDPTFLKFALVDMKEHEVRDVVLPMEMEEFIIRAREQKITVILADVPRYEMLENVIIQSPMNQQKMSVLILDLQTKYGIKYLKYPDKLGLDNYVDFYHFNQKGRERYSYWLLSCLSKL
ncbi:hypothetical protein JNL27_17330 [bacterium]|nr:hypothetical protein [bacterium]